MIQVSDECAALRASLDLDQSDFRERAIRLANGDAAHPKLLGHVALGWELLAGLQFAFRDRGLYPLGDLRRHATIERLRKSAREHQSLSSAYAGTSCPQRRNSVCSMWN